MMKKLLYEIKKTDIGKGIIKFENCKCCGQRINPLMVNDLMGNIQAQDVGKRIYLVNGIEYVENNEQLKKRLDNESL